MAHDVFICHSSTDKAVADAVCARLESAGVRCWIAPRDILPGRLWGEAILDGIRSSRVMIVILSSEANRSPQILREVERAVHQDLIVIPFRIEDVLPSPALEYYISTPHWLDAMTPPLERHVERLVDTVQRLFEVVEKGDGEGTVEPSAGVPSAPRRVEERDDGAEVGSKHRLLAFVAHLWAPISSAVVLWSGTSSSFVRSHAVQGVAHGLLLWGLFLVGAVVLSFLRATGAVDPDATWYVYPFSVALLLGIGVWIAFLIQSLVGHPWVFGPYRSVVRRWGPTRCSGGSPRHGRVVPGRSMGGTALPPSGFAEPPARVGIGA